MTKKVLLSLMVIGLISALVGGATFAYFTSQATNTNNVFATGTLTIGASAAGANVGTMNFANKAPGDSDTYTITVNNLGSLDFKYKVSAAQTAGDAALYAALMAEVKVGSVSKYSGPLSGLSDVLLNSSLAAGGNEAVSFTISLPTSAGNALQGKSATMTFTFDATQTTNPGWAE